MSRLQRDLIQAKMMNPPPSLDELSTSLPVDSILEDDSSSSASSISSTGTIRPNDVLKPLPNLKGNLRSSRYGPYGDVRLATMLNLCIFRRTPRQRIVDPLDWRSCFAQDLFLKRSTETVDIIQHAYVTSPSSPKVPLFVTHHGAGSSGLSFAILAAKVRQKLPDAGFLSIDARGHGQTSITTIGSDEVPPLDLTLDTLSNDLHHAIQSARKACKWSLNQPLIFIGHSLGGAVVVHLVNTGIYQQQTVGYAVLDVVEGSAIDALSSMQAYLSTRPLGFGSLENGIEWHLRSRTIREAESARTSVPSLLRANTEPAESKHSWLWRTDLAATQPFWEQWFIGLSRCFLEGRGAKLLILAGTDRLDKELIIGQMQGKFQLEIVPEAGHFVHEDAPEKIADVLVEFWRRNDVSNLVLPPKVGASLAIAKP